MHELKFTLRILRKSPGFTAMAVLALALGIGATTTIFSIMEGVLLRPLPFPDSNRLVVLSDVIEGISVNGNGEVGVTPPDVVAYTSHTHSFASLGAYGQPTYELSGVGDPATIYAARLTGGIFPALGVAPFMGRVFTQQEDDEKQQVAVLSYATWRSRFHGNPDVLGSKIFLDRQPFTVIGVMPRDFEFPLVPGHFTRSELWVPMSFTQVELSSPGGWNNYQMVGRLKPGVSPQQAQADAESIAQEIMKSYPASLSSLHIKAVVRPLHEETVEQARPLIRTLFLAIIAVLLIVVANLAGMLLTRAIGRRREISLRLAMGAGTAALLRQAVVEALVLSGTGGLLGIGLAAVAVSIGKNLLPETLPLISRIGLDWQVLLFACLLAIATGLTCALAPTFAGIRTNVNEVLKEGGGYTGSAAAGHTRLNSAIVIAEIAVAMLLVSAAGLLLRSFEKMGAVSLGFRRDHLLTASYSLPQNQYATQEAVDGFNGELLNRLRQLPGVVSGGITSVLPEAGPNNYTTFLVQGYVPAKDGEILQGLPFQLIGDYFGAMGMTLLRGRTFTEADNAHSQLVVIVNHKISQHYWPGENPIGKRIRWGTPEASTPWMTVVGEVADVKQDSPEQEACEQLYQPLNQTLRSFGSLVNLSAPAVVGGGNYIALRTTLPPEQMQNTLARVVRSIDPRLPLAQLQTMEHAVSSIEAPRRFNTGLLTIFASAAILLAILGIYNVTTLSVARRNQEMAIRMALGSQRAGVLYLVLRSAATLALAGCVLGLVGTLVVSRLLRSFLFGISPFDPVVLALSAVTVLLLVGAVSLVPALRASSIQLIRVLRAE